MTARPHGDVTGEELFVEDALQFFRAAVGDVGDLGADTDLFDVSFFDSLLLVSYLDFIEQRRGDVVPMSESGLPWKSLASIRTAYRDLVATDPVG